MSANHLGVEVSWVPLVYQQSSGREPRGGDAVKFAIGAWRDVQMERLCKARASCVGVCWDSDRTVTVWDGRVELNDVLCSVVDVCVCVQLAQLTVPTVWERG